MAIDVERPDDRDRRRMPERDYRELIRDEADQGIFKVHRDVYADEEIFEWEMKQLFEKRWQFLALEQEIPEPHDYVTRKIGRQSVIVTRGEEGGIHALINVCPHRGAKVCRSEKGNSSRFRCFYHGWTYDNEGGLRGVPDREGYPEEFPFEQIAMEEVPRLVNYRGMIFGSLNPQVEEFEEYLGPVKPFVDAHWARWPEGVELVGYTKVHYDGNWKLRNENMVDGYHVPVLHNSWRGTMTMQDFQSMKSISIGDGHWGFMMIDPEKFKKYAGIGYEGEGVAGTITEDEKRSLDPEVRDLVDLGGHVGIFPNFWVTQQSMHVRLMQPLDVNKTIDHMWFYLPKRMSRQERAKFRELGDDFWGPSGDATPDDMEAFASIQDASEEQTQLEWLDLSRGIHRSRGDLYFDDFPDDRESPDIEEASPATDDTAIRGFYRYWVQAMNGEK